MGWLGDSMGEDAYATLMECMRTGIEKWTEAVFGTTFTSKGRTYKMGQQRDSHSCGVCAINAIYASIHGTILFTRATHSRHWLEYFITAASFLLQGKVR